MDSWVANSFLVFFQGKCIGDHEAGLKKVMDLLQQPQNVCAVGHRVVHGGEQFSKPTHITQEVKKAIERAVPLAPLHNPANLEGIRVAEELFHCPHVAVFDTAFHSTIPRPSYTYGIPWKLYEELGVRRYGFHGTSYQFLLGEASRALGRPALELNLIAFHLGAGASMCAIKHGQSIDTSMGMTPLEGLVMATRSGDVDPAIWPFLAAHRSMGLAEIDALLNKESGIYGLCGDKDMKEVVQAADSSDKHRLALEVYVHRIRKYLGAYMVDLEGKVDALVFSGGVGERSAKIRSMVCERLEAFGIQVDEEKNGKSLREIHKDGSRIKVLVIPTDEQLCIAQQTREVLESLEAPVCEKSGG
ncbi:hypothetical protein SELMODRAFT_92330 [Selaginella moellendorffii]|uniref:Probable acetate kinase n=1 Tax=Selaginella moellendorffii TaxID=88036 RepID=D8REZ0_SELML|nr:hypothetical protein SELMODRAFT_92330 [Selaginella moellendorffii]